MSKEDVKATVCFSIDLKKLQEVSGINDIQEAIEQELGWLQASGITMDKVEIKDSKDAG